MESVELPEPITQTIKDFVKKRNNTCINLFSMYISYNTLYEIKTKIKNKKFDKLDVILTTPGGEGNAAYMIAKGLRNCCKELNIFVPYKAKSAGTFISLAANNIYLGQYGELGPLDVQFVENNDKGSRINKSALDEFKTLENIKKHSIDIFNEANTIVSQATTLNIKDIIQLSSNLTGETSGKLYEKVDIEKLGKYARALEEGKQYGIKILSLSGNKIKTNNIIEKLVYGYPSHGFVIDDFEAKNIGLPVKEDDNVNEEMDILNSLFFYYSEYDQKIKNIVDICNIYNPVFPIENNINNIPKALEKGV